MYVDVCMYIYIFIFMYTYTYMIRVHIHCIYKHLCCLSVISFEKCLERLLKDHFVPGFAGCGLAALYIIYALFGIILTLDIHNLCIFFSLSLDKLYIIYTFIFIRYTLEIDTFYLH